VDIERYKIYYFTTKSMTVFWGRPLLRAAAQHAASQPCAGADDFYRLNSGSALKVSIFRSATIFAV
jgi:hypothetical protein